MKNIVSIVMAAVFLMTAHVSPACVGKTIHLGISSANDKLMALLGHEPRTPLAQAVGAALGDLGLLRPAGRARLQTT